MADLKTTVIVVNIKDLDPKDYRQCINLNMQNKGQMRSKFLICKRRQDDTKVVLLKDDNGKILSWAIVFRDGLQKNNVYFYTRKTHRRKGFGTIVAQKVKELDSGTIAYPWGAANNPSRPFIEKHQFTRHLY